MTMSEQKHLPQVYWLPLAHLVICSTAMSGLVVPQLQFLGILMMFVNIVDFPISFVALALSFHHDALAWIWMIVVGTLWWYVLSLAAQFLHKTRGRTTSSH